jgi:hypothetical protein
MKFLKALLALTAAAALLASIASTAMARNLSLSSTTWRATYPRVNFEGVGTTECPLTLEGSFYSRTITKTFWALIGHITSANLSRCIRGSATILRETLPWHLIYVSFTGTLPSISAFTASFYGGGISEETPGAGINIKEPVFGIECLATITFQHPADIEFRRESIGALTSAWLLGGRRIPTSCTIDMTMEGRASRLTVLNSSSSIRVTLI